MVERLQELREWITFVDLDGTLLTCNSMREFMKMLPGKLCSKKEFAAAFKVMFWIGMRSLHLISHRRMKWNLIKIARRSLNPADWEEFSNQLLKMLNKEVEAFILDKKDRGGIICIASAAPEEYTKVLGKILGFDGWIATPFSSYNEYRETRGDIKLKEIREVLENKGCKLDNFLTDHPDDLPTVEAFPAESIIVNPSAEAERIFRSKGIARFIK